MGRKKLINKRSITFKNTQSALTSRRVSIILGSPKDSAQLANAVRALRRNGEATFTVSKETFDKIQEEAEKLEKVS